MLIAIVLGIPLGLWAGLRPETVAGKTITAGSILGFSLPTFWVGLMLIVLFAVQLGWLPSTGRGETVRFFGVAMEPLDARRLVPRAAARVQSRPLQARARHPPDAAPATREALPQDYVKFARAKGLSQRRVVGVHVLKNILIPIVTVLGLEFGSVIAFAVVTETIFAWPGMGKLHHRVDQRSRPAGDRRLSADHRLLFVFINLVVDILYSMLDPRVRIARGHAEHGRPRPQSSAPRRTSAPRVETPFRRFVCRASRKPQLGAAGRRPVRSSSSSSPIFAPWIAPQNPYDLAQLDIMDGRLPPGSVALDGHHLLARHRRPGPRHAVGDHLRPAHQPRRRRRERRHRAPHRRARSGF